MTWRRHRWALPTVLWRKGMQSGQHWTLCLTQEAERNIGASFSVSQAWAPAPEVGSTSRAELRQLLTISFGYPLALAAGHWQIEKMWRWVSLLLEGANSGGCKHTGMLRKRVQHVHIHIARHEKPNQLNLSFMVWRPVEMETRGVVQNEHRWGRSVARGQEGKRMKIKKNQNKIKEEEQVQVLVF